MADCDLEALSLSELKKMQKDVAKAISTFEDRQKAEARAKVEALARVLDYSLDELLGTETKSSRAPAAAKYRHPENAALTWSGRGAQTEVVRGGVGSRGDNRGTCLVLSESGYASSFLPRFTCRSCFGIIVISEMASSCLQSCLSKDMKHPSTRT
jgi:DNA-binding protein H-NS